MKNRTTKDPRVTRSNGQAGESRVIVLEVLEMVGKDGATIEEIVELVGKDLPGNHPKMSAGSVLSRMEADNYVVRYRGRWYLPDCVPDAQKQPLHMNGLKTYVTEEKPASVAPFIQKRRGKTVLLYRSPVVYADAIAIAMLIQERWYKISFFVSMRICIGQESPNWSAEQEMYNDVSIIKIIRKDGTHIEERPAPTDIVTIAEAE